MEIRVFENSRDNRHLTTNYHKALLLLVSNLGIDYSNIIENRINRQLEANPNSYRLLELPDQFRFNIQSLAKKMIHEVIAYLENNENELSAEQPNKKFTRMINSINENNSITSHTPGTEEEVALIQNQQSFVKEVFPLIIESLNTSEMIEMLGDWAGEIDLKSLLIVSLDKNVSPEDFKELFYNLINEYAERNQRTISLEEISELFQLYLEYIRQLGARAHAETVDYVVDAILNIITTVIGFQLIYRSMEVDEL